MNIDKYMDIKENVLITEDKQINEKITEYYQYKFKDKGQKEK